MLEEFTQEWLDAQSAYLKEMFSKREELHPNLVEYVHDDEGITHIDHPLIKDLYNPGMNAYINDQYERKRMLSEELMQKGKYDAVLNLVHHTWRLRVFGEFISPRLTPKQYYQMLAAEWMHCENIWQYQDLLKDLLQRDPKSQKHMMSKRGRKILASLPDTVTIYRGATERNRESLSWTLDKKIAEFFVSRYSALHEYQGVSGRVYTGVCKKPDIIALLLARREQEVIIDPDNVRYDQETYTP